MYEVTGVSGRLAILFHSGNRAAHTRGCILVGHEPAVKDGERMVLRSRPALTSLRNTIHKDEFTLTIIGGEG